MGRAKPADDTVGEADGTTPERTCAVTRAKHAPAELIRFVRAPDGTITPDLAHRLPGRGVWVAADRATVEKAALQNAFARSLKQSVLVPDGLAALVERLIVDRCVQALSMANKAGLVIAGFAKVEAAVGSGSIAALVHAGDASADGAAKLDGKLRARYARTAAAAVAAEEASQPASEASSARRAPAIGEATIITDLAIHELSLALGRENVVHAAVIKGGAARYFLTEVERLKRYRSSTSAAAGRPPRTRSNTEQV